jgi:hypothetical protein
MSRKIQTLAAMLAPILTVIFLSGCEQQRSPGVVTAQSPGSAPPSAAGDKQERALTFIRCMRESGVNLDDPDASGNINLKPEHKVNPNYAKAFEACKKHMPEGGRATPAPFTAEQLAKMRDYAKCMRDNGVADFPDPGPNGFTVAPKDQAAAAKANAVCAAILGVNPSATAGQG